MPGRGNSIRFVATEAEWENRIQETDFSDSLLSLNDDCMSLTGIYLELSP